MLGVDQASSGGSVLSSSCARMATSLGTSPRMPLSEAQQALTPQYDFKQQAYIPHIIARHRANAAAMTTDRMTEVPALMFPRTMSNLPQPGTREDAAVLRRTGPIPASCAPPLDPTQRVLRHPCLIALEAAPPLPPITVRDCGVSPSLALGDVGNVTEARLVVRSHLFLSEKERRVLAVRRERERAGLVQAAANGECRERFAEPRRQLYTQAGGRSSDDDDGVDNDDHSGDDERTQSTRVPPNGRRRHESMALSVLHPVEHERRVELRHDVARLQSLGPEAGDQQVAAQRHRVRHHARHLHAAFRAALKSSNQDVRTSACCGRGPGFDTLQRDYDERRLERMALEEGPAGRASQRSGGIPQTATEGGPSPTRLGSVLRGEDADAATTGGPSAFFTEVPDDGTADGADSGSAHPASGILVRRGTVAPRRSLDGRLLPPIRGPDADAPPAVPFNNPVLAYARRNKSIWEGTQGDRRASVTGPKRKPKRATDPAALSSLVAKSTWPGAHRRALVVSSPPAPSPLPDRAARRPSPAPVEMSITPPPEDDDDDVARHFAGLSAARAHNAKATAANMQQRNTAERQARQRRSSVGRRQSGALEGALCQRRSTSRSPSQTKGNATSGPHSPLPSADPQEPFEMSMSMNVRPDPTRPVADVLQTVAQRLTQQAAAAEARVKALIPSSRRNSGRGAGSRRGSGEVSPFGGTLAGGSAPLMTLVGLHSGSGPVGGGGSRSPSLTPRRPSPVPSAQGQGPLQRRASLSLIESERGGLSEHIGSSGGMQAFRAFLPVMAAAILLKKRRSGEGTDTRRSSGQTLSGLSSPVPEDRRASGDSTANNNPFASHRRDRKGDVHAQGSGGATPVVSLLPLGADAAHRGTLRIDSDDEGPYSGGRLRSPSFGSRSPGRQSVSSDTSAKSGGPSSRFAAVAMAANKFTGSLSRASSDGFSPRPEDEAQRLQALRDQRQREEAERERTAQLVAQQQQEEMLRREMTRKFRPVLAGDMFSPQAMALFRAADEQLERQRRLHAAMAQRRASRAVKRPLPTAMQSGSLQVPSATNNGAHHRLSPGASTSTSGAAVFFFSQAPAPTPAGPSSFSRSPSRATRAPSGATVPTASGTASSDVVPVIHVPRPSHQGPPTLPSDPEVIVQVESPRSRASGSSRLSDAGDSRDDSVAPPDGSVGVSPRSDVSAIPPVCLLPLVTQAAGPQEDAAVAARRKKVEEAIAKAEARVVTRRTQRNATVDVGAAAERFQNTHKRRLTRQLCALHDTRCRVEDTQKEFVRQHAMRTDAYTRRRTALYAGPLPEGGHATPRSVLQRIAHSLSSDQREIRRLETHIGRMDVALPIIDFLAGHYRHPVARAICARTRALVADDAIDTYGDGAPGDTTTKGDAAMPTLVTTDATVSPNAAATRTAAMLAALRSPPTNSSAALFATEVLALAEPPDLLCDDVLSTVVYAAMFFSLSRDEVSIMIRDRARDLVVDHVAPLVAALEEIPPP